MQLHNKVYVYKKEIAELVHRDDLDGLTHFVETKLKDFPVLSLWAPTVDYFANKTEDIPRTEALLALAMSTVGQHPGAAPLWKKYFAYLLEQTTLLAAQHKGRFTATLRTAFRKALLVPLTGYDALLRLYGDWERDANRDLADRLVHEAETAASKPKRLYKQRLTHFQRCVVEPPVHFSPKSRQNASALKQSKCWRALLDFELGNPQELSSADFFERAVFTYNLCVAELPLFVVLWVEFAEFLATRGGGERFAEEKRVAVVQRMLQETRNSAEAVVAAALYVHKFPLSEDTLALGSLLEQTDSTKVFFFRLRTAFHTHGQVGLRRLCADLLVVAKFTKAKVLKAVFFAEKQLCRELDTAFAVFLFALESDALRSEKDFLFFFEHCADFVDKSELEQIVKAAQKNKRFLETAKKLLLRKNLAVDLLLLENRFLFWKHTDSVSVLKESDSRLPRVRVDNCFTATAKPEEGELPSTKKAKTVLISEQFSLVNRLVDVAKKLSGQTFFGPSLLPGVFEELLCKTHSVLVDEKEEETLTKKTEKSPLLQSVINRYK